MAPPLPYKINPVKATCMRCDMDGGCGIHTYNDTCFNICAAYSGTSDPYAVDSDCAQSCKNMIEEKRHEFYGVGYCDHQQPYRPVIWESSPPYFVNLLQNGMDPKKALEISKKLCEEKSSSIASECIERQVDYYNALEKYQAESKQIVSPIAQPRLAKNIPKNMPKEDDEDKRKNPIFYILLFAFLVAILLTFLRKS